MLDHEITQDNIFDSSQGLFVAAGLSPYDGTFEYIEEPKYGELVFEYWRWGNDNDDIGQGSFNNRLETHPCSDEELGLKGKSDTTFPIHPQY